MTNNNNGTDLISPLTDNEKGPRAGSACSRIMLLPDSVANQIAAGEVIQRPASVIKELVENSVDAGATSINVLVVNAGKTSIQVIDNGLGMSVTDARLAFERHATSKIRKAEDLFSLHTMGFRGEALPSIASVAQVTLKTRQESDNVGIRLHLEGGKVTSQEPEMCQQGCNFLIENLFYNVPVRRRFLKTNATELTNIVTAFERIVLVYPHIAFTLHSNDQELMSLKPGNTHQRIVEVFGKKINQGLLPLSIETSLGKITGFVGKPESSRKKNLQQYFFVNGRYMKHGAFHKAVINAYDRMIPQGEQVPYFIYFDVNPESIDVNIHPTKTEIKFQDESAVWQILHAAVREAIGKHNSIPTIDFDTEGKPEIPIPGDFDDLNTPTIDFNPSYNPFSPSTANPSAPKPSNDLARQTGKPIPTTSPKYDRKIIPSNWDSLYEGIDVDGIAPKQMPAQQDTFEGFGLTEAKEDTSIFDGRSTTHMQYKGGYILTSVSNGLMVTDQERAHERILFEQYMREMGIKKHSSQKILFPETVQFTLAEMVSLPVIIPEMEVLGFEISELNGGTYTINAVPAGLEGVNATRLIKEMISSAVELISFDSDTMTDAARKELFSSLATSMAANAAIPHGQVLTNEEMEHIISDLLACENSRYTPRGKQIYNIVSNITTF